MRPSNVAITGWFRELLGSRRCWNFGLKYITHDLSPMTHTHPLAGGNAGDCGE